MEHGRDLDGLGPSTYEATLEFNLDAGYPVGAFLPSASAQKLVGADLAWVFQPYVALPGRHARAGPRADPRRPRLRAPRGACPRRLHRRSARAAVRLLTLGRGEGARRGVLVALAAALAGAAPAPYARGSLLPLGFRRRRTRSASSASAAGPGSSPLLVARAVSREPRPAAAAASAGLAGGVPDSPHPPARAWATLLPPTQEGLTSESEIGNLIGPLNPLQAVRGLADRRLPGGARCARGGRGADVCVAGAALAVGPPGAGAPSLWSTPAAARRRACDLVSRRPGSTAKAMATASPVVLLLAGCLRDGCIGRARRGDPASADRRRGRVVNTRSPTAT